ncbi:ABC transporter permease [Iamia sp. SCSIO 61187]|uniref:ABC transporter permease n=1 Tax=Iamia sp. SCSIO 61187 TaxID=2722752 RepID=UPI002103AB5D|nr:ABC transporter permease [Iamia sp. SCSIO 61187]
MTTLLLRPGAVLSRNVMAYRRMWFIFLTGFVEPLLYLGSIGIGVGELVGDVPVAGVGSVPYREFVAPALVATAAMNGAVFDATFGFFFKLKYSHSFAAMLATPLGPTDVALGELSWCLLRGSAYSGAFLGAMWAFGLIASPWAILALPVTILIGLAFAGVGMAATTWMRSFVDFDKINLVLIPLFLFSATFFPLSRYPGAVEWVVRVTPLYQGVHLVRSLCLGHVGPGLLVHVAYLVVMGAVGLRIASRRLDRLLQP